MRLSKCGFPIILKNLLGALMHKNHSLCCVLDMKHNESVNSSRGMSVQRSPFKCPQWNILLDIIYLETLEIQSGKMLHCAIETAGFCFTHSVAPLGFSCQSMCAPRMSLTCVPSA